MYPGSKTPILGLTDFSKIWNLVLLLKKNRLYQIRSRPAVIQFLYQVTLHKNLFLKVTMVIPSVVTGDFPVSYLWSIFLNNLIHGFIEKLGLMKIMRSKIKRKLNLI